MSKKTMILMEYRTFKDLTIAVKLAKKGLSECRLVIPMEKAVTVDYEVPKHINSLALTEETFTLTSETVDKLGPSDLKSVVVEALNECGMPPYLDKYDHRHKYRDHLWSQVESLQRDDVQLYINGDYTEETGVLHNPFTGDTKIARIRRGGETSNWYRLIDGEDVFGDLLKVARKDRPFSVINKLLEGIAFKAFISDADALDLMRCECVFTADTHSW